MDVTVTIAEFKRHLTAAGYAPKSIELYSWGLTRFQLFLDKTGIRDMRTITHRMILNYQQAVSDTGFAAETRAIMIRSIKRLFDHLTSTHKLLINPTEGIVATNRQRRPVGTVLTLSEIKQLLEQPNLSLKRGIRDRTIMDVLYATAIRGNELVNLTIYDADLREKVLYIRKGKGRSQRVTPLGTSAAQNLAEYLTKIRPHYARKNRTERSLFLKVTGKPLTTGTVRAMLRNHRIAAGIQKNVTAHTFRRTCATHLLQNGADVRYVQKLLGHKYLKTTQRYTKIIPVDVKKTHRATHPNEKE